MSLRPLSAFRWIGGAVALAAVAATTPALSSSLPAPATLNPGDTNVPVPDFPASASVVATQTIPFGGPSGPAGTLTEFVVNNAEFSPYGAADLVFAFKLSLSSGDVHEISLPGYSGLETAVKSCNVLACIEGPGAPPDLASRSADGYWVSFFFDPTLTGDSAGFSIYTNATSFFDPPHARIIDLAGDLVLVPTYVPGAPEPSTWAMFLIGFGALGGLVVRRRRKDQLTVLAA